MTRQFPPGFLFGGATAAQQYEGNIPGNDYSDFEARMANQLAATADQRWGGKINPALLPQARRADNYRSGQALNHWDFDTFCADLDWLRALGLTAYRLSVEWARIEPILGYFDSQALAHYRRMLKAIRDRGMKVILTLWHHSTPLWVMQQGGWTRRRTVRLFEAYAETCINSLGDLVDYWTPINEIGAYPWYGYWTGEWSPGKKYRPISYLRVVLNLIAAHRVAADIIALDPEHAPIGIAQANTDFVPMPNHWLNRQLARLYHYWNDHFILDRVQSTLDFIGLNHYFPMYVNWLPYPGNRGEVSDMGHEIGYESMYQVIMDAWRRYGLPIMITESGLPDASDTKRPDFLVRILGQVHRASQDGANVFGYLYWSPFDCFEWGSGWTPRYGLFAFDPWTQTRTKRPSADVYAQIIRDNALPD